MRHQFGCENDLSVLAGCFGLPRFSCPAGPKTLPSARLVTSPSYVANSSKERGYAALSTSQLLVRPV